jgi:hypothetical protein
MADEKKVDDAMDVTVGPVHVLFDGRSYLVLGAFGLGLLANTAFAHALYAKLWSLIETWLHAV